MLSFTEKHIVVIIKKKNPVKNVPPQDTPIEISNHK